MPGENERPDGEQRTSVARQAAYRHARPATSGMFFILGDVEEGQKVEASLYKRPLVMVWVCVCVRRE